jgi:hypothetical protein
MFRRKAAAVTALTLTALALSMTTVTAARSSDHEPIIARNVHGPAAVKALGNHLDTVARRYDKTPLQLTRLLRTDHTVWADRTGALHVKEPLPTEAPAPTVAEGPYYSNSQTFTLHSNKAASRKIFLDFDGGPVAGTSWNAQYGVPTTSQPPFDLNGSPGTWSQAELDAIQSIFQRVSEDYRPFDVDVTTQDPGAAALERSSASDTAYGTRALITPSTDAANRMCSSNCGGIAYIGIFGDVGNTYYQPAWVFSHLLSNGTKYIAEAISHEVGHNIGLNHDGTSSLSYYAGHRNWAPIMGVGYYEPLVQWSMGEYPDANNHEDDFAVAQNNGLPLKVDDVGSTFASAKALGAATTSGGNIERRTDQDFFSFTRSCAGSVTINANPFVVSPNLDIQLRLTNSARTILTTVDAVSGRASEDVASGLNASITRTLTAGTYFLRVVGVGVPPGTTGYTDYGSLGKYTLAISAC